MDSKNIIIGSVYETSFRLLYLLQQFEDYNLNRDRIINLEFVSVYTKYFEIDDFDLHGMSSYIKSEYYARYHIIKKALSFLKNKALISSKTIKNGEIYFINDEGRKICENIQNSYKTNYLFKLVLIKNNCKNKDLTWIEELIKRKIKL